MSNNHEGMFVRYAACPEHMQGEVLNLNDVANLLRVHPKTVRQLAQAGKIPGFRLGRLWRFSRCKVQEWVDSHSYNQPAVCVA